MKLALSVGSVDYLSVLDQLTVEQLQEWQAFDLISPIGADRLDDAIATFMTAMIRYVGGFVSKEGEELSKLEPASFLPSLRFREQVKQAESVDSAKQSEMDLTAARINMEASLILAGQGRQFW